MKKQICAVILCFVLAFHFTACGSQNESGEVVASVTENPSGNTETHEEMQDTEVAGNILIAYFSRVGNTDFPDDVDAVSSASLNLRNSELTGNTELIAQMIQQETGGELFRIETEKKYPADYEELVDYGRNEPEEDSRPVLVSHVEDMGSYNVIFLGFPNWWFDMPMAVYSFLDEYDFSGKTVIPFCTHGGSGFSDTVTALRNILPDATVLDGFEVYGERAGEAGADITAWLEDLRQTVSIPLINSEE